MDTSLLWGLRITVMSPVNGIQTQVTTTLLVLELEVIFFLFFDVHHACNSNVATVHLNIVPFTDGPKDVATFGCFIQSSSDNIYLIWTISRPGYTPVEIMYNGSSTLNVMGNHGRGVSAVLTRHRSEMYIESSVSVSLITRNVTVNCRTATASAEETFSK